MFLLGREFCCVLVGQKPLSQIYTVQQDNEI
jgi:hypothetical protein